MCLISAVSAVGQFQASLTDALPPLTIIISCFKKIFEVFFITGMFHFCVFNVFEVFQVCDVFERSCPEPGKVAKKPCFIDTMSSSSSEGRYPPET